ncbi:unnamed protein product [Brassicogethes aeneus]|uniref:Major facilitator superfamily (MFS) profile domain-containing protein n=1 Tax=Brassicogethes aeneus TaxID=1431903 RepID=A0A9P0AZ06_BRAAE|nr:unnamed protein product [Brassicogethes aeneus]
MGQQGKYYIIMFKHYLNLKFEGFLSCTTVLYLMIITGCGVNYMLRMNLVIAIIDMTKPNNFNSTKLTTNSTNSVSFNWTILQKTEILSIFLWGYTLTVFIGGRLAETYGARWVTGIAISIGSLITLLFPLICKVHYNFALASRFLMGILLSAPFPCIPLLAVNWIPPLDRSKFTSNFMAQSLGSAITLPICGYFIVYLGWESVFYLSGAVGLFWSSIWFYTIYDTPYVHPRISFNEKSQLLKDMKEQTVNNQRKPSKVPWRSMLTSVPVWAVIVTQTGNSFYHLIYVTQLPTYINDVLGFKISDNGLISSLPYIGNYIFACIGSYLADCIRKNGISTTMTRKIFIVVSFFIPSILLIILGLQKLSYPYAVTVLILIHSFKGCNTANFLVNSTDIAPNYAATIFGAGLTFGSLAGYFGNIMVGWLTKEGSNFESWKMVFIIISSVNFLAGLFFILFGSGNIQKWNYEISKGEVTKEVELKPLKS